MRFPTEIPPAAAPVVHKHTKSLRLTIDDLRGGKKGRHPDYHKAVVAVCSRIALDLWAMGWTGPQIGRLLHKHHTTVGLWLRIARKSRMAVAQ